MPVETLYTPLRQVVFRFYGSLHELLISKHYGYEYNLAFKGRQTVKHLMESLGVPHTEVGLILSGSQVVGFEHIPANSERVAVYPHFECLSGNEVGSLNPVPEGKPRFVIDGHLGRLAAYLRLLGFDAAYRNDSDDRELAELAMQEERILLTRDRGLLKRKTVVHGCCLLSLDPREQLLQVARRFRLKVQIAPFTRCMVCNGKLHAVRKEDVLHELEPKTKRYFEDFKRCQKCRKIYWAGSHHKHMRELIFWLEEQLTVQ